MPKALTKTKSAAQRQKRLSANMEDYLEVIYQLSEQEGVSRVSRIAETIGVKRPSVSKAIKRLRREGLVEHAPYGTARVTPRGREVAQAQVKSHRALTRFLREVLSLSEQLAEHDACLIEHAISGASVDRLVQFIDFLDAHGENVVEKFRQKLNRIGEQSAGEQRIAARTWTSKV